MKLLSVLIASFPLVCLCTADLVKVYDGIGALSFKLLAKTYVEGENGLHSSWSISRALGMCLLGADGSTLRAMQNTMGLQGLTVDSIKESFKTTTDVIQAVGSSENTFILNEANKLYLNKTFVVRDSYSDDVKKTFKSEIASVNFMSEDETVQKEINKFVSDSTKGLIPKILDEPLNPETLFAIVNALYFKGAWAKNFTINKSDTTPFNKCSGSKNVSSKPVWMAQKSTLKVGYSQSIKAQLVEVPYVSDNKTGLSASMVFILPDPSSNCALKTWIKSLQWQNVKSSITSLTNQEINLIVPKFEIETKTELADPLKALGLTVAFSDTANFSKMVDPAKDSVKIDRVIHAAKMIVDEKGTEAAAATIIGGVRTTAIRITPTFRFDRSFIAVIVVQQADAVAPLFTALVNTV